MNTNEIVIYQPDNNFTRLEVKLENETVGLIQVQIEELFGVKRPTDTKRISNMFKSGELLMNTGLVYSVLFRVV